jgi:predicted nucleotidyltransferase
MSRLEAAALQIAQNLDALGRRGAVIGGVAVSARCEPRFTRDLDLAIAAADDADAEGVIFALQAAGYRIHTVLENTAQHRLATVRLESLDQDSLGIVVDLLFASSGIEAEIVSEAEPLEVFSGITLPVARVGHLLVLKLLARDDRRRPQDRIDIRSLLTVATPEEITRAKEAAKLIQERGFSRGRDLRRRLTTALRDADR